MSTNAMGKVSSVFIPNLKRSDYEFNRFDKTELSGIVSVLKFLVTTESYSSWEEAAVLMYEAIIKRYSSDGIDVYCFIASPAWKKDTRIVRHYGLERAFGKEIEAETLEFIFEKNIVNDSDVIFYGLVKLTSVNARAIFRLLSTCENGVLFSSEGPNDPNFSILVEELANLVAVKSKSLSFNLNIVDAINLILTKGAEALFPYAWEETGEYHIDVFDGVQA